MPASPQARVSIAVYLQPLFEGGVDALPPGSSCSVNVYTDNHQKLQSPDLGMLNRIALHVVQGVGMVHAMIMRLQAILLPVRTLVLSGGH